MRQRVEAAAVELFTRGGIVLPKESMKAALGNRRRHRRYRVTTLNILSAASLDARFVFSLV